MFRFPERKDLGGILGGSMKRKRYFVFCAFLPLCAAAFLGGCSDIILFDPKGPIGSAERFIIIVAIALMLIVVIPVHVIPPRSIWPSGWSPLPS
jgi:cytochrome o ubiquinol oxidase subunit 2